MAKNIKQNKSNVHHAIIAIVMGILVAVGALYLFATLIVSRELSQNTFFVFSSIAVCLGCMISSFLLAMKQKENGLLCGLICFCVFMVILLMGGWCNGLHTFHVAQLLRGVLLLICSGIGGCWGVIQSQKHLRHK